MLRFRTGLIKLAKNPFDGPEYPATCFEDIGKSRFMQLSSVKEAKTYLLHFKRSTRKIVDELKVVINEKRQMQARKMAWLRMSSEEKKS